MTIKLICLDADDTLWHNERHFQAALQRLAEIVPNFADARPLLEETEHRNIPAYGFGVKGFTLSVLETAAHVMGPVLDGAHVQRIIAVGKDLLAHPVELLDGIALALDELHARAPLVLVTKGDLLHQETKLAASGLGERFASLQIVSDKRSEAFTSIFKRHAIIPDEAIMIGDSLRSDILPALEAGAYAAYIPHPLAWSFEVRAEPAGNPRYRRVAHMREIPPWIDTLA